MRRLLAVALFCSGLFCLAQAQTPAQLLLLSSKAIDPATAAWIKAVNAAGGTVSGPQQARINKTIVDLKTKYSTNYFTSCDHIWALAAESTVQANIDFVGLQSLTKHGTVTFAALSGYTGDGSSGYFDTGVYSGTNYTQNSASQFVYITNSRSTSEQYYAMGVQETGTYEASILPQFLNNLYWGIGAASNQAVSLTNAQGFFLTTITSSSAQAVYKNGSATAFGTASNSSVSVPSSNIYLLSASSGGSPVTYSADTEAFAGLCGGFTGTQSSQIQEIINDDYMKSINANVY